MDCNGESVSPPVNDTNTEICSLESMNGVIDIAELQVLPNQDVPHNCDNEILEKSLDECCLTDTRQSTDVTCIVDDKSNNTNSTKTSVSLSECDSLNTSQILENVDPVSPLQCDPNASVDVKNIVNGSLLPKNTVLVSEINSTSPLENQKVKKSKSKKNDSHNEDFVLHALKSLNTPEEKLAALCQKYSDLFEENRKLKSSCKQAEKVVGSISKEKEVLQLDYNKVVLSRNRLENLCRELQRQNKLIKDESLQKIREEQEKRKEVSEKFKVTVDEITSIMKKDSDKTGKLMDDNVDMSMKLKSISKQHDIREQQIEKMTKQIVLESQLHEAKLAKMKMEMDSERESLLLDKQQLLVTLTEYQARCQEQQNLEVALRNQVTMYSSKYEEFQNALTRSNNAFSGFKTEMDNMSKKIIRLESETANWKHRWENTQRALLEMATEKKIADQEIVTTTKQMAALHKLCRALQNERIQLIKGIKRENMSSPTEFMEMETHPIQEMEEKTNKEQMVSLDKKKKQTGKTDNTDEKYNRTKTRQNEEKKNGKPDQTVKMKLDSGDRKMKKTADKGNEPSHTDSCCSKNQEKKSQKKKHKNKINDKHDETIDLRLNSDDVVDKNCSDQRLKLDEKLQDVDKPLNLEIVNVTSALSETVKAVTQSKDDHITEEPVSIENNKLFDNNDNVTKLTENGIYDEEKMHEKYCQETPIKNINGHAENNKNVESSDNILENSANLNTAHDNISGSTNCKTSLSDSSDIEKKNLIDAGNTSSNYENKNHNVMENGQNEEIVSFSIQPGKELVANEIEKNAEKNEQELSVFPEKNGKTNLHENKNHNEMENGQNEEIVSFSIQPGKELLTNGIEKNAEKKEQELSASPEKNGKTNLNENKNHNEMENGQNEEIVSFSIQPGKELLTNEIEKNAEKKEQELSASPEKNGKTNLRLEDSKSSDSLGSNTMDNDTSSLEKKKKNKKKRKNKAQ